MLRHESNKQPHWVNQDLVLGPCSLELVRMNHSRRWQQRGNFLLIHRAEFHANDIFGPEILNAVLSMDPPFLKT